MKKGILLVVFSFLAGAAMLLFVLKSNPEDGSRPKKTGIIATSVIRTNMTTTEGDQLPANISKAVYSKINDQIKLEEYNITYQKKYHSYQSPNRVHNLRITYSEDGVSIGPRVKAKAAALISGKGHLGKPGPVQKPLQSAGLVQKEKNDWTVRMRISGYGRGEADQKFTGKKLITEKNKAFIEDEMLRIEYENSLEGMRQNFIVKDKPEGEGLLKVALKVKSNLDFAVENYSVSFINDKGKSRSR